MTNTPRIKTTGLEKRFENGDKSVLAFTDLNLEIKKNEFFSIVGPSGCGKTTLLRCLAGIEKPTSGHLEISAEQTEGRSKIAMVFQEHGLYPWMTIEQNLMFVLKASQVPPEDHKPVTEHFLGLVGLSKFKKFFPYQLSGGMNQRVALVRAFCIQPRILLMDEPFVFLDYQNRIILQNILLQLWQEKKQTVVFVTHNINEAAALADRVMLMTSTPGRFKQELNCDFGRPRDIVSLRKNPEYQKIVVEITEHLKKEIELEDRQQVV